MPRRRQKQQTEKILSNSVRPYLIAYGLTVAAFFFLSLVPEWRVWAFISWSWLPLWGRPALLGIAAVIPLVGLRLASREPESDRGSTAGYVMAAVLIGVAFTAAFVLLRQETHFLGDGYTLLQWLEEGGVINKMRNYGAQMTLRVVDQALPGDSLQAFRVVAWGAGMVAVVATVIGSALVFSDFRRRLLLALGVLSGGYMLLFFGYVENYALFVMMVLLYCWVGVVAMRGRISPWWVLLPQAGAIFFHVFGVTLLPATLYLTLRTTGAGKRIGGMNVRTLWLAVVGLGVVGIVLFGWFYTHSYFFRFAFVPIVSNRFTVDGYTLLSLPHLVDFANLLMVLAPALLLFAVAKVRAGVWAILAEPLYRFLGLAALGALGAAFIFDPKLGMPRDWDLFSFGGAPLMMAGMFLLLDTPRSRAKATGIAVMAVGLGLLSLVPRAVVQNMPPMGIAQFEAYRELDPIKNRNNAIFVVDYYERLGDTARAEELRGEWHASLKDEPLLYQGNAAMRAGDFRRAITFFRMALRENPMYYVAYTNLAEAFIGLGQRDSALVALQIADGLNPQSPIILSNLGQAYRLNGEIEKAVEIWQRAAELDPAFVQPRRFLVSYYRETRDAENYIGMLEEIASLESAPPDNLADLADWYVQSNRLPEAGRLYERALEAGLDSAHVVDIVEKYPALREELRSWKQGSDSGQSGRSSSGD